MKTFEVRIYRNGFLKKYVEEFDIKADQFSSTGDGADFYKMKGETECSGFELVAAFKADKYTIIQK